MFFSRCSHFLYKHHVTYVLHFVIYAFWIPGCMVDRIYGKLRQETDPEEKLPYKRKKEKLPFDKPDMFDRILCKCFPALEVRNIRNRFEYVHGLF